MSMGELCEARGACAGALVGERKPKYGYRMSLFKGLDTPHIHPHSVDRNYLGLTTEQDFGTYAAYASTRSACMNRLVLTIMENVFFFGTPVWIPVGPVELVKHILGPTGFGFDVNPSRVSVSHLFCAFEVPPTPEAQEGPGRC